MDTENYQFTYKTIMTQLKEKGYLDIYKERSEEIRPSFFIDPYGIHGIPHAKRVLMLNLILACLNGLKEEDTEILIQASLFHDIGRTHNGTCYEHGRNSVKKMLELGLLKDDGTEDEKILRLVIENHCVDDSKGFREAEKYSFRDRAVELLKIFKDCDNLDRVRLGDLDVRYLRNPYSPRLVEVAKKLLREIN